MQFMKVCESIGFLVADDKTEWAAEVQVFLGLLLHGRLQLIGIPADKLEKGLAIISFFLKKRKVTVKQFLSLAGTLNFLVQALDFGRPFLRRLYDATIPAHQHLNWHLRIGEEVKQDLLMCETFLETEPFYKNFISHLELPAKEVRRYTDASGAPHLGFRCYLNGMWYADQWPTGFVTPGVTSTCFLELVALTASVILWGPQFAGERFVIHCDNQANVAVVNNLTSKCSLCM